MGFKKEKRVWWVHEWVPNNGPRLIGFAQVSGFSGFSRFFIIMNGF